MSGKDYKYGTGKLILRVTRIGRQVHAADGEWLDLDGFGLDARRVLKAKHTNAFRRGEVAAMEMIPNLHGSPMHVTAVALYGKHHGDAAGRCVQCGEPAPCPTRAHAASVIMAADEDPCWHDVRLSPPAAGQVGPDERPTAQLVVVQTYPDHSGYRVGGRDVRDNAEGLSLLPGAVMGAPSTTCHSPWQCCVDGDQAH